MHQQPLTPQRCAGHRLYVDGGRSALAAADEEEEAEGVGA